MSSSLVSSSEREVDAGDGREEARERENEARSVLVSAAVRMIHRGVSITGAGDIRCNELGVLVCDSTPPGPGMAMPLEELLVEAGESGGTEGVKKGADG